MPAFPRAVKRDLPADLQDILERALADAASRERPYLIHMLGPPGAGKSTMAALLAPALERALKRRPAIVSFDAIMEEIPDYRTMADPIEAFQRFEVAAREAGYALIRALLTRRADLLIDHGGSAPEHPAILAFAIAEGYSVYVVEVTADPTQLRRRIALRQSREGRHTPPAYLDDRERAIGQLRPAYRQLARRFIRIDNGDAAAPARWAEHDLEGIVADIARDVDGDSLPGEAADGGDGGQSVMD